MTKVIEDLKGRLCPINIESGKTFTNADIHQGLFADLDLSQQFFNGAHLRNCLFEKSKIVHVEFREAKLKKCKFKSCDLNGSDIVYSQIEECTFIDCDFTNGEWLESQLFDCDFINCHFHFTTLNLNRIKNCTFDKASFNGLDVPSVQYNIFENCLTEFRGVITSRLLSNFGLKNPTMEYQEFTHSRDLFMHLSLLYFTEKLDGKTFINILSEVLDELKANHHKAQQLKAKYLHLICQHLIATHYISNVCIRLSEEVIVSKIRLLESESLNLFNELISMVFSLRKAKNEHLIELEEEIKLVKARKYLVLSGLLRLKLRHEMNAIEQLVSIICDYCRIPTRSFNYTVNYGSTEILFFIEQSTYLELVKLLTILAVMTKGLNVITKDIKQITASGKDIIKNIQDTAKLLKEKREDLKSFKPKKAQKKNKLMKRQQMINLVLGKSNSSLDESCDMLIKKHGDKLLDFEDEADLDVIVEKKP